LTNKFNVVDIISQIITSAYQCSDHSTDSWIINHTKASNARRGKPLEKRKTPVEINGVIYSGVIDAANSLKVSRQCVNRWIKKGKAKYV